MTPSERARRLNAAAQAIRIKNPAGAAQTSEVALNAADDAVPVVSVEESDRAERAEAAARDFGAVLRAIRKRLEEAGCGEPDPSSEWYMADVVLRFHPSFSGEEGTDA